MPHACPFCGSQKWRKNPSGDFVCKYGHVLTIQEETTEDSVALINSQRRKRTIKRVKQEFIKESNQKCEISQFQTLLISQCDWLEAKFDNPDIKRCIRDLWLIYRTKSSNELQSGFTVNYSLAFCYLAINLLAIPAAIGDLLLWVVDTDFPFLAFDNCIQRIPESRLIKSIASKLTKIIGIQKSKLFNLEVTCSLLFECLNISRDKFGFIDKHFSVVEREITSTKDPCLIASALSIILAKLEPPRYIETFSNALYLTHMDENFAANVSRLFKSADLKTDESNNILNEILHVPEPVAKERCPPKVYVDHVARAYHSTQVDEPVDPFYMFYLEKVSRKFGYQLHDLDYYVQKIESRLFYD